MRETLPKKGVELTVVESHTCAYGEAAHDTGDNHAALDALDNADVGVRWS